jgi:hypothetical protein
MSTINMLAAVAIRIVLAGRSPGSMTVRHCCHAKCYGRAPSSAWVCPCLAETNEPVVRLHHHDREVVLVLVPRSLVRRRSGGLRVDSKRTRTFEICIDSSWLVQSVTTTDWLTEETHLQVGGAQKLSSRPSASARCSGGCA